MAEKPVRLAWAFHLLCPQRYALTGSYTISVLLSVTCEVHRAVLAAVDQCLWVYLELQSGLAKCRSWISPVLSLTWFLEKVWSDIVNALCFHEEKCFQKIWFITGQDFASQSVNFIILLFAGYKQCIFPGFSIIFCFLLSPQVSYLELPFRSSDTCWASVIGDLLVWDGAQTPTFFFGKESLVCFLLSGSLKFCSAVSKSWCL